MLCDKGVSKNATQHCFTYLGAGSTVTVLGSSEPVPVARDAGSCNCPWPGVYLRDCEFDTVFYWQLPADTLVPGLAEKCVKRVNIIYTMYTLKIVANALMLGKSQINHVECSSRFALYIADKSAIEGGVPAWGPTFSKK